MPGINGFKLLSIIRESSWNKTTPVVVITGDDDSRTMSEVFAAGATLFLSKPLDLQKLTRLYKTVYGIMMEERLRFRRIPVDTEVEYELDSQKLSARSLNLSQEGMLLDGISAKPGDSLRLSFRLPGQTQRIEVVGTVDRIYPSHRLGIRFTWISRESRQKIRELVANQTV
jgi:CheY-like chemotaxis protein